MRVLIFGATGMVGQGVLRECLLARDVTSVVAIGRTSTGQLNPKLSDLLHKDLFDYRAVENSLTGFDACFFCLGVPSAGKTEAEYARLTYELTLAAATTLARLNPQMTFVYVSGAGADSTERGRTMWARVRGRTENELQKLPFKAAYAIRPGLIQPLHGARSKTSVYRVIYSATRPLLYVLRALFPSFVLTTERVGQAMLEIARNGAPRAVLETPDIEAAARRGSPAR